MGDIGANPVHPLQGRLQLVPCVSVVFVLFLLIDAPGGWFPPLLPTPRPVAISARMDEAVSLGEGCCQSASVPEISLRAIS